MADMTEDNARLQAVVSLLSTGPVAVSDRINHTDLDLVSRSQKLHHVFDNREQKCAKNYHKLHNKFFLKLQSAFW